MKDHQGAAVVSKPGLFSVKRVPWLVLWAFLCGALALWAEPLGIAHLRGWIAGVFVVGEVLIYGATAQEGSKS